MFSLKNAKTGRPVSPTEAVLAPVNGILTDPMSGANGVKVTKALPSFDELPKFHELTGCAWKVWGTDDELGTVNMLTEDVVQRAAREEIRCVAGDDVCVNCLFAQCQDCCHLYG